MTLRNITEVAFDSLEQARCDRDFEKLFDDLEDRTKRLILLAQTERSHPLFYRRRLNVCTEQMANLLFELRSLQRGQRLEAAE